MTRRHLIPIATVLLMLAVPDDARADVLVGADAGAAIAIGDWSVDPGGPGFDARIRLGYELPVPVVRLVAEVLGGYTAFPADDAGNAPQNALTGRAGARIGIGGVIGPMLYGHVGYTYLHGEASDYDVTTAGMSYDAGLAVDFTLLPLLNVGIHGGYNAVTERDSSATWIDAGAHVELSF
jgi:hypothetical protein